MPKKRGVGQFTDLREGLDEKEGGGFELGLIPQCTLCMLQFKLNSPLTVIQLSTHTTSVIQAKEASQNKPVNKI